MTSRSSERGLHQFSPHDRPREKLARMGAAALGDNELVAIVIGAGCRDGSAIDVANHVLATVGGARGLTRVSAAELQGLRGIGRARAAQLLAASNWVGARCCGRRPRASGSRARRRWPRT